MISPRPVVQSLSPSTQQPLVEAARVKSITPLVRPTLSVAEDQQRPLISLVKSSRATQDGQSNLPITSNDSQGTSSIFSFDSNAENNGLPSADVLFGSGPSLDIFGQPSLPFEQTPIQNSLNDASHQSGSLISSAPQDVDSLFATSETVTLAIQHQFVRPEAQSSNTEAKSKIISSQVFNIDSPQTSGTPQSQPSPPVPFFVSETPIVEPKGVQTSQNVIPSATPQDTLANEKHESLSMLASSPSNFGDHNGTIESDMIQECTDTKSSGTQLHQDSSSLFNRSDDTDASHFFSVSTAADSSGFFSGLSRMAPSITSLTHSPKQTTKKYEDSSNLIGTSISPTAIEVEHPLKSPDIMNSECTPISHAPIPFTEPALAGDVADLFGSSVQNGFISSVYARKSEPVISSTPFRAEESITKRRTSLFDNFDHSHTEGGIKSDDMQSKAMEIKESPHTTNPGINIGVVPESLSESQQLLPSLIDMSFSQKYDDSHVTIDAPYNPRRDLSMIGTNTVDSTSQLAFGDDYDKLSYSQNQTEDSMIDLIPISLREHGLPHESESMELAFNDVKMPQTEEDQSDEQHPIPFTSTRQSSHLLSFADQQMQHSHQSLSDLFNQAETPHSMTSNIDVLNDQTKSISDIFNQPSQPFAFDLHMSQNKQHIDPDHFNQQLQLSTFDTLTLQDHGNPISTLLPEASHSSANSEDLVSIHFNTVQASEVQGESNFNSIKYSSNKSSYLPERSQGPECGVKSASTLLADKDLPSTQSTTFSLGNQLDGILAINSSVSNQTATVDGASIDQPHSAAPQLSQQDQLMPFDESLPSPVSPGFDRSTMGSFISHDSHGSRTVSQPSSYSIMELSSAIAHTSFFSQTKESTQSQSQERVLWSNVASESLTSEQPHGVLPKLESEISAFDQVSLVEDTLGTNQLSSAEIVASTPVKERGLASLLDPSTLSAVEDLLNMPKSAAFERGMSRLFKGVKSSASSMFSAPLSQLPSKSLAAIGSSSVTDQSQESTDSTASVSGQPTIVSSPSIHTPIQASPITAIAPNPTSICPSPTAVLPPPPRRTLDKEQSKLPPPPRISHWPAVPDITATVPNQTALTTHFDWAHKQSKMFLEPTFEGDAEIRSTQETLSTFHSNLPNELIHEASALASQTTVLMESTISGVMPNIPQEPSHAGPVEYSFESQEGVAQQLSKSQESSLIDNPNIQKALIETPVVDNHALKDGSLYSTRVPSPGSEAKVEWQLSNEPKQDNESCNNTTLYYPSHSTVLQHTVSPTLHHHTLSPSLSQRTVSPALSHHVVSPTLYQRAISPSVLDPEVLLRKQAAVHALLADQATLGGTTGAVRAKPDKERLLEKARGLLEKRQQSAGVHTHGASVGHTGITLHKFAHIGSRSSGEWAQQDDSSRRSSILSRDQFPSPTLSHHVPTQHPGAADDQGLASYVSTSSDFGLQGQRSNVNIVKDDLNVENERLREHIRLLQEESKELRVQIESQGILQSEISKLRKELEKIRAEPQTAQVTHQNLRSDNSQQLVDMSLENQHLQSVLTRVQSDHHSTGAELNDLMKKYQQLETELIMSRQICAEQGAMISELQKMKEISFQNEQLQQELEQTQRELHKHRTASITATNMHQSNLRTDGNTLEVEQLSQETEGLRRQLKGQKQEMKELQELVKRADVEKRDLVIRIGQLEHALAEADKHRDEQKSHQVMKDKAYKDIQERLVAAFEEEKAQYLDDEAFKMVKMEHRYNLLQEEVMVLRAKEVDRLDKNIQSNLTLDEEAMLRSNITHLELELEAARLTERELRAQVDKSINEYKDIQQDQSCLRRSFMETEDQVRALQAKLEQVQSEGARPACKLPNSDLKQISITDSSSEELRLSLERKRVLKEEQKLATQIMKHDLEVPHDSELDLSSFEQNRLAENASRWQEECLAAKEETMRVEDQLQRAQLELMAAKTEILQLEANLAANGPSFNNPIDSSQEHAGLQEQVTALLRDIQKRDVELEKLRVLQYNGEEKSTVPQNNMGPHSERYIYLEQQLAMQMSKGAKLEEELINSRALLDEANAAIAVNVESNQSGYQQAVAVSEEDQQKNHLMLEDLKEQNQEMRNQMLEKQAEIDRITVELDSVTLRLSATEEQLDFQKAQRDTHQQQLMALDKLYTEMATQREAEAAHQTLLSQQADNCQNALNQQISTLMETKRDLEISLNEQITIVDSSRREKRLFEARVEELEQKLMEYTTKTALAKDEEIASEEVAIGLKKEISSKEGEIEKAKEQILLITNIFEKLMSPLEDPEELVSRENMMTQLTESQPLGVSVRSLLQVGALFLGMQKEMLKTKTLVTDLESRLNVYQQQKFDEIASRSEDKHAMVPEDLSEIDNLRQQLVRAEDGISKLQQFLQEFQNEKKRAIYELQQQLQESEEEVTQTRSQLAKAQALLLSRPSMSSSLVVTAHSPDLSQSTLDRKDPLKSRMPSIDLEPDQTILRDETFKGTEPIHHEAILALEPMRQQKAELERTLLDLRHRYELSQKENDALLSRLEKENKELRGRIDLRSPDISNEQLERIRELELEQVELKRQLITTQREREFTRQDMRSLKAELAKLRTR
ncbi:hypothetical protein FBU30_009773 [Linnemannia zychae]|nr:hypothetical protein FBU30_009773 [Linnemannia zychae]